MSERDLIFLLEDMLEAAKKIKKYTANHNHGSFIQNDMTIDAVVRNFEIIREAANRIPQDFRKDNSELEWNHLRGFRNRIVHEYFGIDYDIIWTIIENDLDYYISLIEKYLLKTLKK